MQALIQDPRSKVGGVHLNLTSTLKALGYNISKRIKSSHHVTLCVNKARASLSRLQKFKQCSPKVKKKLYQALVLPLLDYPCVQLYNSGKSNISKIQKVQNQALRFINNSSLIDKIPSKSLHKKFKIKPINLRLKKLAFKSLTKLINLYKSNSSEIIYSPFYKLGDYEIEKPPHFNKKQTLLDKIVKVIWQKNHEPIFTLPDNIDDWGSSEPVYL